MPLTALYDVDEPSRDIHRVIIELAESLDDAQIRWLPAGHATSIGFHLWHVARESDYLRSTIVERVPLLGPDFGPPTEIWAREGLAARWGFAPDLATAVGTGLTDEIAASLPIPGRVDLLEYLRRSFGDLEAFVTLLDERHPDPSAAPPELGPRIVNIRRNILGFLTHDCRHLGMMEILKGLQTGFGSATETRP